MFRVVPTGAFHQSQFLSQKLEEIDWNLPLVDSFERFARGDAALPWADSRRRRQTALTATLVIQPLDEIDNIMSLI